MKRTFTKKIFGSVSFLFFLLILGHQSSLAQPVMTNNGAVMFVGGGGTAVVYINGGFTNQNAGTVDNSGKIIITGDMTNNAGNGTFVNNSPGEVELSGGNQLITGSDPTSFFDLSLTGTGIKTQTVDASVDGILSLSDRELATDSFAMAVLNASPAAITRSTGFVSSLDTGSLAWIIDPNMPYTFPVGSSLGTQRYRPVTIRANSLISGLWAVRMANVDATSEGFDRSISDGAYCAINPDFYHRIRMLIGIGSADITTTFDDVMDNPMAGMSHWQGLPRWEGMNPGTVINNNSPVLSEVTVTGWSDFSTPAFAMGVASPNVSLVTMTDSICASDMPVFYADSGFVNYEFFQNGVSIQNSSLDSLVRGGISDGDTIQVVSSNAIGCTATSQVVMTVVAPPSLNIGVDTTICSGLNLTLDAGNPGSTYLWSTGDMTQTISVGMAGTYSVMVTNATNCSSNDTITIAVSAPPVVSLGNDTSFCDGNSLSLDAGNPGATYMWSNGATTQTINVSTGATYSVTVTNNCPVSDSITVAVTAAPTVDLGPDLNLCPGINESLDAGNPGSSYNWSTGDTSQVINVVNPGTYSVTVTNVDGCMDTDSVTLAQLAGPTAAFTHIDNLLQVDFSTNIPNIQSYSWNFGDGNTGVGANPSHTYAADGTYYACVIVTDSNGCKDTSCDSVTVLGVGMDGAEEEMNITVFPNPSQDRVVVLTDFAQAEEVSLEVYSAAGVLLIRRDFETGMNPSQELFLGAYPDGIYMLRMIWKGQSKVVKVVKMQ